jgi:PAS domain S-box-containing protein
MSLKTLGRVLVVDDEIQLMDTLVEALTAQGYAASGFRRGEAALQALHAQEFDLLLTDLMMPGMDGITLLKAALAIDENLVGIIMTGQGTVSTALEAMKTGAFDYVLKPFRLGTLLPVLKRAMEVRRLRLENIQLHETVAIYNLSQTLAFSLDSKQALAMTADAAIQQTDADEVSIMLLTPTPGNDELYIAAVRGGDREHLVGQRSSLQEGIAGWVARQTEPLILNGEVSDPRFAPIRARAEISSAISIPMLAARKLVGVLNVNSLKPRHPFTLGQAKALSILTSTAAAALENEALYSSLEARENRFRALIENSSDAVALLNAEGRFLYTSASAQRVLGYAPEELVGQNAFELIHPDDREVMLAGFMEAVQKPREAATTQLRVRHKDGSWRWIEGTAQNLLSEPSVQALVVNYRDITARKQTEETLIERERLLSEAQRIAHIGSWSYDILADALTYSDEMYLLFDVSSEEFQHNSAGFMAVIYSPDRPMVAKWMEEIRGGSQVGEVEFLVFRKNSELRYIRCRGAVQVDKAGKPARFIGTAQDVTERKLAEIQIRQQIEHLTALRKIDQAISSSFDLSVTLDILLSQVISQLHVDAADVLLLDSAMQMLEYAAGRGFRTNAVETGSVRLDDSQAARERRLIHIEYLEYKPDKRLLNPQGISEGFVCYFGVPLMVKGKVKGVLEMFQRTPLQPYPEWLDFLNTLAGQAAIAIENSTLFENLEHSNQELSQAYDATIVGWSRALDLRDRETEGHTLRVTEMTLNLTRAFGLPEEQLFYVRWGALLHDIGKMGVPDHILLKSGALTEEEWLVMRSHPDFAYDLLKPIAFLAPALDIPYCHHEKWDGTGYPRGLKGEEIPLVARLFAVVDVWDALRSDRPYRLAWPREKTLEHIKSLSGTHFDPKAVESFLELIED